MRCAKRIRSGAPERSPDYAAGQKHARKRLAEGETGNMRSSSVGTGMAEARSGSITAECTIRPNELKMSGRGPVQPSKHAAGQWQTRKGRISRYLAVRCIVWLGVVEAI